MMLVAFSGVDCAGKSTQIELLRQYFVSHGMRCAVFWYRPGYSRELQWCKDRVRPLLRKVRSRKSQTTAAGAQNKDPRIPAPVWVTAAFFDAVFQWAAKLRILMCRNDVVICDRYIDDARLDIAFKYPDFILGDPLFAPLSHLIPKPDLHILLWLPYEEMIARATRKNEPFPDDPQTRRLRYRAYGFMSDLPKMSVIDASGSVEQTHGRILDEVRRICPK